MVFEGGDKMREVTVEEIFSILYTEHNDSVKDGV